MVGSKAPLGIHGKISRLSFLCFPSLFIQWWRMRGMLTFLENKWLRDSPLICVSPFIQLSSFRNCLVASILSLLESQLSPSLGIHPLTNSETMNALALLAVVGDFRFQPNRRDTCLFFFFFFKQNSNLEDKNCDTLKPRE